MKINNHKLTNREINIFLIEIYTYSGIIIDRMDEMQVSDPDALKFRELLYNRRKQIESQEVRGLFTKTKIIPTLIQKFRYIIEKEFAKIKLDVKR